MLRFAAGWWGNATAPVTAATGVADYGWNLVTQVEREIEDDFAVEIAPGSEGQNGKRQ